MSIYDSLNEPQKQGVYTVDGPVLLLAGAGSGKTRVLTHRIAYLIDEMGVNPWNILAITFTNKAAGELKERLRRMLGGEEGDEVFASTFHSACVRMLRRDADRLGFPKSFTIYDTSDQERAMKEVYKQLLVDDKFLPVRSALGQIGRMKDQLISPEDCLLYTSPSPRDTR